jgi:chromosome segregation protein
MYVRSLRLSGFKSFADPTVLEFEPGVNVIVGPNGSGKSNIADALSWVLGSQAPSSVRGAAMEDVIFAGSQGRQRLGTAEVELTLDNSDGSLPIDVAEVTVSRFTDRTGNSEYRINGAPCRLLDVTELLSDTGIGRTLHALVGQGQLDQVLQARPEERRAFIEEAAQIGKFRKRKDRALKKIERVEDNLMRLNDVVTELKRAIRPLKRQATAASAHSELMTEFQELKQRLTATELHELSAEERLLALESEERRSALLTEELAGIRAQLTGAADEREALAADSESAQTVAHRMGRAADRLQSLGRLARERAERLSARLAAETEEGYRERIRLLEVEHRRWQGRAEELEGELDSVRRRATESGGIAEAARSTREEAERALAAARGAETEAAQALVRAEGSESAGRATIESIEARVQAVVERRQVTTTAHKQDAEALEAAEQASKKLERELDDVTTTAARAEDRLERERERTEDLKKKLGTSHAEAASARARLQTLEEVAGLLADLTEAQSRIAPLLADAERAASLSDTAEDEANALVKAAEEVVEERWQEVARLDEELRHLDALMSAAVERVTGARRRREAREIEMAALDEELARVKDSLAAAQRAAVEERAALPARRAALEEARAIRTDSEARLATARTTTEKAEADAAAARLETRSVEERSLAARLRVEEAEAGIADARKALSGLAGLREELGAQVRTAEVISEAALAAAGRAQRWAREATESAEAARARARDAEHKLTELRQRERALDDSLQEAVDRKNKAEVRRAEMRARSEAVAERALDEWGLDASGLAALPPLSEAERLEARERADHLERQIQRLGPVNPRADEEYKEALERQEFLTAQMEDLRSSKNDLLRVVREVDDTIVEVFSEAFEDVAREFQATFDRLFPGGAGGLKLTDAEDLLGSGIEIEARPPGKNVKKMSLLSGGERALVALAFLFAIFRSRPSPFYLLDEVEAALDDVNLQRFLTLVADLRERAQVMVVTHQKRTMESAQILYGVSMAKDGVSQVVAKRMEEAPVV